MERRDFIKLCSMTGLGVVAGSALSGSREAHAEAYKGTLFINCSQMGGMDVTNVCDPKGADSLQEAQQQAPIDAMNRYLKTAIREKAGVRWAGLAESADLDGNQNAIDQALKMDAFFEEYADKMLVINGVDHQTNSHDVGARLAVTGNAAENSAAFGAVAAAALLPTAPMGFVGFGGYTGTAGLTAVTRLGNIDVIKRLAYPYRIYPDDPEYQYFNDVQGEFIAKAREERFNARMQKQKLPRLRNSMNTLYLSRLGQNELKRLVDYLPEDGELLGGLAGATQLIAAAYKAGLCVSASLSSGGWDNHGDVDTQIANSLGNLLDPDEGVPRALKVLTDEGLMDKTLFTMTSDFGRTPGYNMGNGKDHWPISSMILLGGIGGKKLKYGVKGGSDERHESLEVDPDTGVAKAGTGVTIKAGHIHNNLRKLAGILESDAARLQPTTEDVNELSRLIELA